MKRSKALQVRPTAPLRRDLDASEIASLQVPAGIQAMLENKRIPKDARAFVAAAVRLFLNPASHPAESWTPPKTQDPRVMKAAIVAKVNADMKRLGFGDQFQIDIFTIPGVTAPVASITPRRTRRGRKG